VRNWSRFIFSTKHILELGRNVRTTSNNRNLCLKLGRFVSLIGVSVLVMGGGLSNASDGATVIGQVIFNGTVSPPKTIEVLRDPDFCGASVSIQNLVVDSSSKGVQGVVVSVEGVDNPAGKTPQAATPELRNRDCAFVPRIGTATAKTRLHITNEDPIMHNTHIRHGNRTFVNVAQVPGVRTFKKPVKRPGILKARCDKHEFMEAFILVFAHPYYSVTDTTGHFRISSVPSGLQELTIWHETLGIIHTKVEVPEQGEVSITVKYPNK